MPMLLLAILSIARIKIGASLALQLGGNEAGSVSTAQSYAAHPPSGPEARGLIVADSDEEDAEDIDSITDETELDESAAGTLSDVACIHKENLRGSAEWSALDSTIWRFPSDSLTALGGQFHPHQGKAWVIMGVGVPKSASTFAYWTLYQHNETLPSQVKETRFFDYKMKSQGCDGKTGYNADIEKYASCFYGHWTHPDKAMLEFSPQYFGQEIESNIKQIHPVFAMSQMRFLALVREPITRLESQITMKRTNGKISKSDFTLGKSYVRRVTRGHFDYGNYYESISQWVSAFGAQSLLVVNNDALTEVETWRRVYVHSGLRLPSDDRIMEMVQHASRVGVANHAEGQYMKFSADQTKDLEEHFKVGNDKLWALLNVAEPWW